MYNMYLPYNYIFFLNPFIPPYNQKPPTLFSILNSIANFGKDEEERTKVKDLAKVTHTKIFDFDYPLSSKINKDKFEINILNKFLKRRIGTETVVDFKIELEVKLNEIMPKYNKMFDFLAGWDLFSSGEIEERISENTNNRRNEFTETNNTNQEINKKIDSDSNTTNTLENTSNNETNLIQSHRESNTPQGYIENVQDNAYLSKYNYNEDTTTSEDITKSKGSSQNTTSNSETSNITNNENRNNNTNETNTNSLNELIKRSPSNKIRIYEEFQNNIASIYTMIYNELSSLFLQVLW